MKKVLFITRYPLNGKYALRAKFDGQMFAMKKLGYDVSFFAYDDKYYYLMHEEEKCPLFKIHSVKSFLFHHILSYVLLYKSVIKVLRKNEWGSDDYAYIRSMPREFYWRRMKKALFKTGISIIVEVPTYIKKGAEKPRLYIRVIHFLLNLFGRDNYTNLYAVIGDSTDGQYNNTPAINIDNGVTIELFNQRQPASHNGINFVAVGNMSDWHGFDRVIVGLSQFDEKDDINFYIVGPDGDGSLEKWKKLTENLGLTERVHFTGPKFGEELVGLLNKCDVAFASLGMYRTGCFNASVLKSREYMSRGIPFVYAVNDPVLDSAPTKYALKIPNDSTPVDISQVIRFAKGFNNLGIMTSEMRDYAVKYMSWEGQFKKVFSSLKAN